MKSLKTFFSHSNKVGKLSATATIVGLLILANTSGVFGGFWRTFDNLTTNGVDSPSQNLYGYGYGDLGFGYGYGYGYGYGDIGNYQGGYYSTIPTVTDSSYTTVTSASTFMTKFFTNSGAIVAKESVALSISGITVSIPAGTEITDASGGTVGTLSTSLYTPTISSTDLGGNASLLIESKGAISFGEAGNKLFFSKPVEIKIPVTAANGTTLKIKVKHFGGTWGTDSLATSSGVTCTNGIPSTPANSVVVAGGFATIYTCAASDFTATSESTITTSSSSSGGGGGGGSTLDNCPNGDKTASYYDGKCGDSTSTGTTTKVETSTGTIITTVTSTGTIIKVIPKFNDITDSFAKKEIEALAKAGIIKGFEDGSFGPNRGATRAEFLKMALGSFKVATVAKESCGFKDVTEEWQVPYIAKAKELGIISGQTIDGVLKFRPNDGITRAEAIKILLKVAGIKASEVSVSEFKDVTEEWQVPYIAKAKELGIVSGQTIDGVLKFRPNDGITRAEVAKIIVKAIIASKSK